MTGRRSTDRCRSCNAAFWRPAALVLATLLVATGGGYAHQAYVLAERPTTEQVLRMVLRLGDAMQRQTTGQFKYHETVHARPPRRSPVPTTAPRRPETWAEASHG